MTTAPLALAEAPVAAPALDDPNAPYPLFFDPGVTVLSQYAQSPVINALIGAAAQWFNPSEWFDEWFADVRDIDTATGHGLDVWGRILGVSRVLQVPTDIYLGFSQDAAAQPFGFGIFYSGGFSTQNVTLTDDAFRQLLLAKAAFNITNCSIPAINTVLLALFGQGYVIDHGNMAMTYHFPNSLTPVQTAIIYQAGVLPKPAGVAFTVEHP